MAPPLNNKIVVDPTDPTADVTDLKPITKLNLINRNRSYESAWHRSVIYNKTLRKRDCLISAFVAGTNQASQTNGDIFSLPLSLSKDFLSQ